MIKNGLIFTVILFAAFYLANSFVGMSFDPSDWTRASRVANVLLPFISTIVTAFIWFADDDITIEKD